MKNEKSSDRKELTEKQAAFCLEYIVDFNGAQAAIRAGYAKSSARVTASKLLTKTNIQAEIKRNVEERNERTKISADQIVDQFARIAFFRH